MDLCGKKLVRAEKLIGGLGGEKERWTKAADDLQSIYDNLLGDVLVSGGVVAYLGIFTSAFRDLCTNDWIKLCRVIKWIFLLFIIFVQRIFYCTTFTSCYLEIFLVSGFGQSFTGIELKYFKLRETI